MRKVDNCPLCDAQVSDATTIRSTDYLSGDAFTVATCSECGMAFTTPYPTGAEELARYYPQEDYYGSSTGRRFNPIMERMISAFRAARAKRVLGVRKTGRVLDIGCGRALLLQHLKSLGWECYGTELSESLASHVRETSGIEVRTGELRDMGFEDGSFDVVTAYHVLEHISNPRETLTAVRRLMKSDGLLVVGVPNLASVQARMSRGRWFHLDVPRHVVHFTPDTLARMLRECGFEITSRKSYSLEYDPYGLVQSLLNIIGCKMNLLYQILRRRGIAKPSVKTILYDVPVSLLLAVVLVAPAIALELVLSLAQLNGTMEFRCRPAAYITISSQNSEVA